MKRYQTSLCVSLLFVSATLCAAPAWAASWTQVKYMQTSEAQPDYPQTPTIYGKRSEYPSRDITTHESFKNMT